MDKKQARAFESFVAESGDMLLRIATLLTCDVHLAEDVYQETLQRLAGRWARVENPRAFCRRVMHNIVIDQQRARQRLAVRAGALRGLRQPRPAGGRPAGRGGTPPVLAGRARHAEPAAARDRRPALLRRSQRERGRRAAGVSVGTVKSTASRAVARLREQPGLGALLATSDTH